MALRKIFCPFCGQATQVNDDKAFCFCLECGSKIELQPVKTVYQAEAQEAQKSAQSLPIQDNEVQNTTGTGNPFIDEKLKEAEFYYSLSVDKKEDINLQDEPVYFLKAQDLLVDLSQQYPNDYRVWWELCKPLDFHSPLSGADVYGRLTFNENYFNKALDLAALDKKKELIDAHDQYLSDKRSAILEMKQKRKAADLEREKARAEEERRQREEQERQQLEIQKQQQERALQAQKEQERQKELRQQGIQQSAAVWEALARKDYSSIDASFFQFAADGNQTIIGIFRVVSNVLYLMSFRIDANKNNALLRDQTITIRFDGNGVAHKFDNKPVRIKGMVPPNDMIHIVDNGMGGYSVNDMPLNHDIEYVNNIMKNSKKPLISFNKTFL